MTKKDIIDKVAISLNCTHAQAHHIVDEVFNIIHEGLMTDREVKIYGFGVFSIHHNEDRIGINPATKEKLRIPAKQRVRFKPSDILKAKINR